MSKYWNEICDYDEGYTKADADEIGWCRTSCGNTKCKYHPKHHKCPRCGYEYNEATK